MIWNMWREATGRIDVPKPPKRTGRTSYVRPGSALRLGQLRLRRRQRLDRFDSPSLGVDEVHHGVDEREVRERLREVAEMTAVGGVDLLAVQAQRAGIRKELLAQPARTAQLADLDKR